MSAKKRKVRADFRKNRVVRARDKHRVERGGNEDSADGDAPHGERMSGKGHISRKRTVAGAEIVEDEAGTHVYLDVDRTVCRLGRVLRVQGLISIVRDDAGKLFQCATRRLLKTLATDQRHVVAAGDIVWFRPEGTEEGIIERVEPRHGVVSRTSRGRQHVLVANVDQLVIVTSAAEPRIKPNLIDRLLVTAEKAGVRPIICINKIDLIEPADLMPLVGVYAQLGYDVLFVSAATGIGIDRLRARLADRESVVSGQSGVGKSSLLNAAELGLHLRVQSVSEETQKGRHTTTTAELIPLSFGGYVVDTPGIRQFQLWDVIPEEVAGYFRELRPYVSRCRFPDCTHTHEDFCAVKDAVADSWIDARRYESYVQIRSGDMA
ncbi:MAG TPA: ribosome small subunit-dependent GTPase A [Lacipirellulaceae bacterium]|jgi:ribosome biogenesis GTPase|nr:ribosome small subunit-dependent GTPase A [Lacipirellulaceae bacterium]